MPLFTVTIPNAPQAFANKAQEMVYIKNVLAAAVQQFAGSKGAATGTIIGLSGTTNGGARANVGTWTYTTTK